MPSCAELRKRPRHPDIHAPFRGILLDRDISARQSHPRPTAFVGSAASIASSTDLPPRTIAQVAPFNAHSAAACRHAVRGRGAGGLVQSVFSLPARTQSSCLLSNYVRRAAKLKTLCITQAHFLPPPHNYMLSSNCNTLSFALNLADWLPEIAARSSPRRIISTSAAA